MTRLKYGSVEYWRNAVSEQIAWMARCGVDLTGYVTKYGSKDNPDHCGEGGEAIYQADCNELERVTQKFNKAVWKRQNKRARL